MEKNGKKVQVQMQAHDYFLYLIKKSLSLRLFLQGNFTTCSFCRVSGLPNTLLCVTRSPAYLPQQKVSLLLSVSALSEAGREQTQAPSLLK